MLGLYEIENKESKYSLGNITPCTHKISPLTHSSIRLMIHPYLLIPKVEIGVVGELGVTAMPQSGRTKDVLMIIIGQYKEAIQGKI